jgi:hypothetical protein
MSKIAESDATVTDPNTGLEHKVFAGQPVPNHLLSEEEREDVDVIGSSTFTPPGKLAEKDEVRTDPVTGLTHKIIAGQPIPANLRTEDEQDDEEEADKPSPRRRSKVQTEPDKET